MLNFLLHFYLSKHIVKALNFMKEIAEMLGKGDYSSITFFVCNIYYLQFYFVDNIGNICLYI